MWGTSFKVGCGFSMYKEGGWWKKLYTCNYGPGGNIIRQQMYRRGSPCSACPADTTCSPKYPGLCGKSNSRRTGSSFCKGQLESVVYDLPKIKKKSLDIIMQIYRIESPMRQLPYIALVERWLCNLKVPGSCLVMLMYIFIYLFILLHKL